jgi:hypothetical protein
MRWALLAIAMVGCGGSGSDDYGLQSRVDVTRLPDASSVPPFQAGDPFPGPGADASEAEASAPDTAPALDPADAGLEALTPPEAGVRCAVDGPACLGCCAADGSCQPGTETPVCGVGGNACVDCSRFPPYQGVASTCSTSGVCGFVL